MIHVMNLAGLHSPRVYHHLRLSPIQTGASRVGGVASTIKTLQKQETLGEARVPVVIPNSDTRQKGEATFGLWMTFLAGKASNVRA